MRLTSTSLPTSGWAARGFTLVELMVTITVMAILTLAAAPSVGTWIADSRIRSVAESLQNGIRLAEGQALATNHRTVFGLTNSAPAVGVSFDANGGNWVILKLPLQNSDETAATFVQGNTSAKQYSVSIASAGATSSNLLCFSPLGQQVNDTAADTGLSRDCTAGNPAVYIVSSTVANSRPLRVLAYQSGAVRLCDPALSITSNQDACPAT